MRFSAGKYLMANAAPEFKKFLRQFLISSKGGPVILYEHVVFSINSMVHAYTHPTGNACGYRIEIFPLFGAGIAFHNRFSP